MLLSELIDETYTQTLRPDLVDRTTAAIKSATLFAHHSDFFARDLYENGIVFDESLFIQSLAIGVIPSYRKIKYIRAYDNLNSVAGEHFTILTPEELIDDYGLDKTDVAYEAGTNIEIRGSTAFQHLLIGAYVSPTVTDAGYNSWVADNFPYAIIYSAARIVLTNTKDYEGAKAMKVLADEQLLEMRNSALAVKGE